MRAIETSKVLSWRWAPCVALVLGASCFAAFAALVIPERIGDAVPSSGSAAFRLGGNLASTRLGPDSASRFADGDSGSSTSTTFSSLPSHESPSRPAGSFPKRGFTPPLDRPEPPPPPPPVAPEPPAVEVPPPQAVIPAPLPAELPVAQPQDPQSASAGPDQTVRNTD